MSNIVALDDMPDQRIDPKRGNYIATLSGVNFYVDELNIQDIPLEDMAHALSMNCRYNGHVERFYSVAEHSILVSKLVPEEDALWGLLHDITEAFVPDVPRPFKALIYGFKEFEDRLAQKLAAYCGLPWPMPETVHYIDKHIVGSESRVLFPDPPDWVDVYDDPCPANMIKALTPEQAERAFIDRYKEITNGKGILLAA